MVSSAWDKFLDEELLGDTMETITKTSVGTSLYYFVHYGKKSLLTHIPGEQFDGSVSKSLKGLHLKHRQRRFQKKLSELVISAVFNTSDSTVLHEEKQVEESVSSDEDITEDIIFCEHVTLTAMDTPCLSKDFGNESKHQKVT